MWCWIQQYSTPIFIDYRFCRDFGKSFHTCTNRGNCQKSKLFPWPKTTSWHSPTSYVSIGKSTLLIEVTCFWRNLLATTSNRKTLKGEHQQLSNEYFKRQQAERDFWRSLSLPSFFLFDYWYAYNWRAPYYKAKRMKKIKGGKCILSNAALSGTLYVICCIQSTLFSQTILLE